MMPLEETHQNIHSYFESGQPDIYIDFFKNHEYYPPTYELSRTDFRSGIEGKLAGYQTNEFKSLADIYQLVHPEDYEFLLSFSHEVMKFIHNNSVTEVPSMTTTDTVFRIKGNDGKLYFIRRHTIINGARKGLPTHYVSYLEDITWMRPVNRSWNFTGVNEEEFIFEFPEQKRIKEILSKREIEVLKLIAKGYSSTDISDRLYISKHTVDTHRKNMIRKLGVSNTPELLLKAIEHNIV